MKIRYVLGFIFDQNLCNIILKDKPSKVTYGKSLWNGIGGKTEAPESIQECLARKSLEDVNIFTRKVGWDYVCSIYGKDWTVSVNRYILTTEEVQKWRETQKNDEIFVSVSQVLDRHFRLALELHNTWLIPMAQDTVLLSGVTKVRQ